MKFFALIFAMMIGLTAQAEMEFGLLGGVKSSQIDTGVAGTTTVAQLGFQAGVTGYLPFAKAWGLRSGFIYSQRYSRIERTNNQGNVDLQYAYFDVPATLMFRFSDFAGFFAGPIFAFNQSKEISCSKNANCAALDVKSIILPWQAGLNFRMLSQLGAELYFEYVPGDLSTDVSNMRTVGANVIFYFE